MIINLYVWLLFASKKLYMRFWNRRVDWSRGEDNRTKAQRIEGHQINRSLGGLAGVVTWEEADGPDVSTSARTVYEKIVTARKKGKRSSGRIENYNIELKRKWRIHHWKFDVIEIFCSVWKVCHRKKNWNLDRRETQRLSDEKMTNLSSKIRCHCNFLFRLENLSQKKQKFG